MVSIDLCRGAALLADLPGDAGRRIADLGTERLVRAGDVLFRLGEEATTLYIIAAGVVDLTFPMRLRGKTRDVRFLGLGPGETLAWSAVVPPHRLTMGARVKEDARLVAFPREPFLALLREDTAIGYRVMANLARVVSGRLTEARALWVCEVQQRVTEAYEDI